MIVFLTLLYCGVLFLLVRLKVIRLNTFWKISPALWFVLLFVVLFMPSSVRPSNELCGRNSLYSFRQASIFSRALSMDKNQFTFRHSSRKR